MPRRSEAALAANTSSHSPDPVPPSPRRSGEASRASPGEEKPEAGLRISDAASRSGVSARTLRYYEELGLLSPSSYTSGGERRYSGSDLTQLERILELRDVLGMNLDEIKGFLDSERRLDELRSEYKARKDSRTESSRARRRSILEEILALNESLAEQLDAKLTRMGAFRESLLNKARRCRELIRELEKS